MRLGESHIRVLIVFANPKGTDPLRLEREDRIILESIRLSQYRNRISITRCHAATVHDIRRALLDDEFHIVHISAHGSKVGLILEDEIGEQYVVPQQALAELFQTYSPPLECVLLNACYSITQGGLISLGVPFTIVMDGPISDKAAIEFSRGFYDAIGAGRDIEFAYNEGCRCVKLSCPNAQFSSALLVKKARLSADNGEANQPRDLSSKVSQLVGLLDKELRKTKRGLVEKHEFGMDQVMLKIRVRNRYQVIRISFSEIEQKSIQDLLDLIMHYSQS